MRRVPRSALLPALLLVLFLALPGQGRQRGEPAGPPRPGQPLTEKERAELLEKLVRGQSRERVRGLLGPPRRQARQLVYQHYREQWVYDEPLAVRLDFDAARGDDPHLLGHQSERREGR
jgi:hypothetical protein